VEDRVAAKMSVLYQSADGPYRNTLDNSLARKQKTFSLRGSVRFTPTDTLTLDLIGDYTSDRSGSFGLVPASALPGGQLTVSPAARFNTGVSAALRAPAPASVFGLVGLLNGLPLAELNRFGTPNAEYSNAFNAQNIAPIDSYGVTLDAVWDAGWGTVRSVTGWRKMDEDIIQDFDATRFNLFHTRRAQSQDQFSTELNVNTDFNGSPFDLTTGVYFFTQSYDLTQRFLALFQNPLTGALAPTDLTALAPFRASGGIINNITFQRSNSYAAFAEGTYKVTDQISVTAGARVTHDTKNFRTTLGGGAGTFGIVRCAANAGLPGYVDCTGKRNWTEFTPRVIAQYKPTDTINAYASWSKGYKAGGFNGRAASGSSVGPFNPEKVEAFEVGLKTILLDRKVNFNVTAFWNDYSDLQVEIVRASPGPSGQETVVENAASARTRGLEVEFLAAPVTGLQFNATIGYLDARYRNFNSPIIVDVCNATGAPGAACPGQPVTRTVIGTEDLTIFRMRRAPEWTFSLGGQYEQEVMEGIVGSIRLDYRHNSTIYTTVRNQDFGKRRPTGLLDGSIAISDVDNKYRLSLYGKNLTDEIYVNSSLAIADGALAYQGSLGAFASYAPRRELGVELAVKF
jgi:iron complex outermembrane recepter protein